MLNINDGILNKVTEAAKQSTGGDSRWINAIDRAARETRENPYLHQQADGLLILSSTSFNVYLAGDSCQCKAHEFGQPCWHRAACQLLALYDEAALPKLERLRSRSKSAPSSRPSISPSKVSITYRDNKPYVGAIAI